MYGITQKMLDHIFILDIDIKYTNQQEGISGSIYIYDTDIW